jgi:hypothetical protein
MVVTAHGGGRFTSPAGSAFTLSDASVLWLHEGDNTTAPAQLTDGKTVAAIRKFVSGGGALFLTGTTIPLVHQLGVEPCRPRSGGAGTDRGQASIRPLVKDHPVFRSFKNGSIRIADRGHPAYSDFHGTGGPGGGMLLARSGGGENPLVEYELGKGRIIVMGWRLPHYSNQANAYRKNLLILTDNILTYLKDRNAWVKIEPRQAKEAAKATTVPAEAAATDAELASLRLAIEDLVNTHGEGYPDGAAFLARLDRLAAIPEAGRRDAFSALKQEALLANPLLDFDQLLLVNRAANNLALPKNWESNSSLRTTGHDNEIMTLSPVAPGGKLRTVYRPENTGCITDLDLHFDGGRVLFSMPGANGRWQLHETGLDGKPAEITTIEAPDVDNYDACYLPDGGIIFTSTATMLGVPCVRGSSHITNLYRRDPDGTVTRLTVDQEHNWCPTVTPSGRVMYQRWEYTDTPHAFYRLMFTMNPDGTRQSALYGSNSYWPNAMFYSRPIPGSESKFVTIVGGHHDQPRMGELILFDTDKGRQEADGVVQRIPGFGKPVEPIILDGLTRNQCPRFLHPFPLSEKYFLVSCQPTHKAPWGIYLVDVFDNFLLLCEQPGRALMEPVPVRPTPVPPVIPSQTTPGGKEASVVLSDVYLGGGLRGVPRGTVKSLRVLSYNFSFRGMGGQIDRVGLDGPWDVRVILGTVPVDADGSAHFKVPAMMPIAVQPLDGEGKAVQYMRSWFTCQPGEVLSCVGCHEEPNTAPAPRPAIASLRPPDVIKPWHGPARGFSFRREVQPVLDEYCIGCHDGSKTHENQLLADLTDRPDINMQAGSANYNTAAHFPPSYFELKKFVRGATIESDAHLLPPWEFHADSTRLMQLLQQGHHGVNLDAEARDRLITWIDLNTPAHGSWREIVGSRMETPHKRRKELMVLHTGIDFDPEDVVDPGPMDPPAPVIPSASPLVATPARPGFTPEEARRQQLAALPANVADPQLRIDLADDVTLRLMRIPAASSGPPFWMGATEITNRQYACFDPSHDSRLEHGEFLQFSIRERGYPLNAPDQPVVRVSQRKAMAFCEWLSEKTGKRFTLPTGSQWEWAARAGSTTAMWYGDIDTDFSTTANLSDATHHSRPTFGWSLPSGAIPGWRPARTDVDDKHRVSAPVGSFGANAFGLHDMAGNVAEWTRLANDTTKAIARGGSWQDTPERATSTIRIPYHPDQSVVDVGFRVICE